MDEDRILFRTVRMWSGMLLRAVLIALGTWSAKQAKAPSNTIGDTRIINGIEYWNMGDENDQDNWRYVGPAPPKYFVNVLIENERVTYTLSSYENEEAVYSEGFYDLEKAKEKIKSSGIRISERVSTVK